MSFSLPPTIADCTPPFCSTTTTTTNGGGFGNPSSVAITITWGMLAILGVVGFCAGLIGTVAIMLLRRTYGIIALVLRPVGYSYKVTYQHKFDGSTKEFRRKNHMYQIDLTRTAYLDWANRPVLIYEDETITPVLVKNTTKKLAKVIEAMKIEMTKKGLRPSDPFDLLFGRKLIEALFAAMRRKGKTNTATLALFIVLIVVVGIMAYFAGNMFPVIHLAPSHVSNMTTITKTVP